MNFAFGPFTMDTCARRLLRGSQPVRLSRKAFELLTLLAERAPEVVSKREIHARLWPGTFVADVNLAVLIAEVRAALGERADTARFVRTVHRVGYAFGDVTRKAATRAPLVWLEWARGAERALLKAGDNLVGRAPHADVRIDARGVSRRHAVIAVTGEQVTIRDVGSKNGTYIAGIRISDAEPLLTTTEIGLGPMTVWFHRRSDVSSTETMSTVRDSRR